MHKKSTLILFKLNTNFCFKLKLLFYFKSIRKSNIKIQTVFLFR